MYFTDYNELISAIVGIHSSTRRRADSLRQAYVYPDKINTAHGAEKATFRLVQIRLLCLERGDGSERRRLTAGGSAPLACDQKFCFVVLAGTRVSNARLV
jgi:hypothetical protein